MNFSKMDCPTLKTGAPRVWLLMKGQVVLHWLALYYSIRWVQSGVLPVAVISELLGVPKSDQAKLARYSNTIIENPMTPLGVLFALPDTISVLRYLRWLIQEKRSSPQDNFVTALIRAEESGDQLNEDELLAMVAILLSAGHETTTNLIGNGILALLQNDGQMQLLRENPALIGSAIEELLRFTSPVQASTNRYALEEIEIAGTKILKGSIVIGSIASANLDERAFDNPELLALARADNKHLAFGQGGHYCIGAPLARMEGQIAIKTLLQRLPKISLAVPSAKLRWRGGIVLRGLKSLPLKISR